MALADEFQATLDSLPPDWTHLEMDLRIADEHRYTDAATLLLQINAMPYSELDLHWRIRSAHTFGHAPGRPRGARRAAVSGPAVRLEAPGRAARGRPRAGCAGRGGGRACRRPH